MPSPEQGTVTAPAPAGLACWRTKAMASEITVQAAGGPDTAARAERALAVFHRVERHCSRFAATSPLVRCNSRPGRWHRVPATLVRALVEARAAHTATAGAFDPRIHDALVSAGYDRSFELLLEPGSSDLAFAPPPEPQPGVEGPWAPGIIRPLRLVHLGGRRVDLGGIGKGLALRWAASEMEGLAGPFLIEAGGDLVVSGAPDGQAGWRVGVEDPAGGPAPRAVLEVGSGAVATSSVRLRRWRRDGEMVHHLMDPRTGRPGGAGLASVTVWHTDPAWAEVWAKVLFLAGRDGVAAEAERRGLAALWVDEDGSLAATAAMEPVVMWRAA